MTDDQHPWYSDPNAGHIPPTEPDGGAIPTSPPPSPAPPPTEPVPASNVPPGYGPQPYPQQAPTGYQPYGQPGFGPIAQSNGKATTSMVLGITGLASLVICYGVLSIVLGPIAFFLGRSAQKEMEATPLAWSNIGMAKAGWIMGLIQTILSVIAFAAIAAFFIWFATLDDSNF